MIETPLFSPSALLDIVSNAGKDTKKYRGLYDNPLPWATGEEYAAKGQTFMLPENISTAISPEKSDAENARDLHRALSHLTPSEASNPFLFTRLAHVELYGYMLERWSPRTIRNKAGSKERTASDKEFVNRLRRRYCVETCNSRNVVRHGIGRLYWAGLYSHTYEGYRNTQVLIDFPEIIERAYGRSLEVARAVVDFFGRNADLLKSHRECRQVIVRPILKRLNHHGAVTLLTVPNKEETENFLSNALDDAIARLKPTKQAGRAPRRAVQGRLA